MVHLDLTGTHKVVLDLIVRFAFAFPGFDLASDLFAFSHWPSLSILAS